MSLWPQSVTKLLSCIICIKLLLPFSEIRKLHFLFVYVFSKQLVKPSCTCGKSLQVLFQKRSTSLKKKVYIKSRLKKNLYRSVIYLKKKNSFWDDQNFPSDPCSTSLARFYFMAPCLQSRHWKKCSQWDSDSHRR